MIGSLLTFVDRFILALVLNLPCLMSATASDTGLLSGRRRISCVASMRVLYSVWMALARDRASISHGIHCLCCCLSIVEWNLTSANLSSLIANNVCPIPGELAAASGLITS